MQIYDDNNAFSDEQNKLVLDTTVKRLRAKGLESRISQIKISKIPFCESPSCEFGNNQKSIIILNIPTEYFSRPHIKFVILHEIQHRVDELNDSFGFDNNKKDSLSRKYGETFSCILAHLWDIYINGRLDREGLYQTDATKKIGIKGQFLWRNKPTDRLAGINFLQSRGVRNAQQVYDTVWSAREGELSYDQLVQLALENMTC